MATYLRVVSRKPQHERRMGMVYVSARFVQGSTQRIKTKVGIGINNFANFNFGLYRSNITPTSHNTKYTCKLRLKETGS
jgi:hypothetical protein